MELRFPIFNAVSFYTVLSFDMKPIWGVSIVQQSR